MFHRGAVVVWQAARRSGCGWTRGGRRQALLLRVAEGTRRNGGDDDQRGSETAAVTTSVEVRRADGVKGQRRGS